jgi:hypothetical protein
MSIFSTIGKALRAVASTAIQSFVPGPVGVALTSPLAAPIAAPRVQRAALPVAPALPGIGAVGRALVLPGAQAVSLLDPGVPGPGIFSPTTPPKGFHLSKQAPFHFVRNRRMNPLNPKAFRRSVRRLKGAVKFAKEVDRVIPIRPRARRAPPVHRRTVVHE